MATEPSSPQALDSVAKDKPEADADRQLGFDQVLGNIFPNNNLCVEAKYLIAQR